MNTSVSVAVTKYRTDGLGEKLIFPTERGIWRDDDNDGDDDDDDNNNNNDVNRIMKEPFGHKRHSNTRICQTFGHPHCTTGLSLYETHYWFKCSENQKNDQQWSDFFRNFFLVRFCVLH